MTEVDDLCSLYIVNEGSNHVETRLIPFIDEKFILTRPSWEVCQEGNVKFNRGDLIKLAELIVPRIAQHDKKLGLYQIAPKPGIIVFSVQGILFEAKQISGEYEVNLYQTVNHQGELHVYSDDRYESSANQYTKVHVHIPLKDFYEAFGKKTENSGYNLPKGFALNYQYGEQLQNFEDEVLIMQEYREEQEKIEGLREAGLDEEMIDYFMQNWGYATKLYDYILGRKKYVIEKGLNPKLFKEFSEAYEYQDPKALATALKRVRNHKDSPISISYQILTEAAFRHVIKVNNGEVKLDDNFKQDVINLVIDAYRYEGYYFTKTFIDAFRSVKDEGVLRKLFENVYDELLPLLRFYTIETNGTISFCNDISPAFVVIDVISSDSSKQLMNEYQKRLIAESIEKQRQEELKKLTPLEMKVEELEQLSTELGVKDFVQPIIDLVTKLEEAEYIKEIIKDLSVYRETKWESMREEHSAALLKFAHDVYKQEKVPNMSDMKDEDKNVYMRFVEDYGKIIYVDKNFRTMGTFKEADQRIKRFLEDFADDLLRETGIVNIKKRMMEIFVERYFDMFIIVDDKEPTVVAQNLETESMLLDEKTRQWVADAVKVEKKEQSEKTE